MRWGVIGEEEDKGGAEILIDLGRGGQVTLAGARVQRTAVEREREGETDQYTGYRGTGLDRGN